MKKVKPLLSLVSVIVLSSFLYGNTTITGKIESESYFGDGTEKNLDAEMKLSTFFTSNVEAVFSIKATYDDKNTETEFNEMYINYYDLGPTDSVSVGEMKLDTDFSDKDKINGLGFGATSKFGGFDLTYKRLWENNIPSYEVYDFDYFKVNKEIGPVNFESSILFLDRQYSFSDAMKTFEVSSSKPWYDLSLRYTKTAADNQDGALTVDSKLHFNIFSVGLAYSDGFLADTVMGLNNEDTKTGFGVFGSDMTSRDMSKYKFSFLTELYGVDFEYNYLTVSGDLKDRHTVKFEKDMNQELKAGLEYNMTTGVGKVNFDYDF